MMAGPSTLAVNIRVTINGWHGVPHWRVMLVVRVARWLRVPLLVSADKATA